MSGFIYLFSFIWDVCLVVCWFILGVYWDVCSFTGVFFVFVCLFEFSRAIEGALTH